MGTVIQPKKVLEAFRKDGVKPALKINDVLFIEEIGKEISLRNALNEPLFHDLLKGAVSEVNQEAALDGTPVIDFDDLYTKYSEYVTALQWFISLSS